MKRKLVGVRPLAAAAFCFKCGNKATQTACYDIGDGFLHTEKFCDSCISRKSNDLDFLSSARAFKEEIRHKYKQILSSKRNNHDQKK